MPVLLKECIEGLNIKADGVYVDCTLGRGGHAEQIARRLTSGLLVGLDRDGEAISEAGERLAAYGERVTLRRADFRTIGEVLDGLGIGQVDGVLMDLGVSSPQLDEPDRGFSYKMDGALDMRMDRTSPITARDIVNSWSYDELKRIFWDYGEERNAGRIAAAIVRKRENGPIETTAELAELIARAQPAASRRERQHPAKRCFQAIRIAVNDELGALEDALPTAMDRLREGGRLAVISFHSLEDRIVKRAIKSRENGCICPPEFPRCVCGFEQTMKSVTKKPIVPSEEEQRDNPRARSAKLRLAERV